jgi:hypothetical protein
MRLKSVTKIFSIASLASCCIVVSVQIYVAFLLNVQEAVPQEPHSIKNYTTNASTETLPNWTIFYNIYVPPDRGQEGYDNALRIVQEQINQIGRSYAASFSGKPVLIYYNTLGADNIVTPEWMNELCSREYNMLCQHIQHHTTGYEALTLTRLHSYCKMHPTRKVVYMHTKGSYHDNPLNENWRYALTHAVVHQDCLVPPDDTCNYCGLQFFPIWGTFMAGNFWTASCSYIEKLLPPVEYRRKMSKHGEKVKAMVAKGELHMDLLQRMGDDKDCQGRFSDECWSGSHPSVIPCDLSKKTHLKHWVHNYTRTLEFEDQFKFALAPRASILGHWYSLTKSNKKVVLQDGNKRLTEYYLLLGNIMRWFYLYNEMPPADSWIWTWFPDGPLWKRVSKEFGSSVVGMVTKSVKKHMLLTMQKHQNVWRVIESNITAIA